MQASIIFQQFTVFGLTVIITRTTAHSPFSNFSSNSVTIMLNIEVEEGFDVAGETIEVVEIHSDILLVVGSLPLLSDVIELIERLDVESVIHALHDFQMHKLIVALVKIVALLVRELHHVMLLDSPAVS